MKFILACLLAQLSDAHIKFGAFDTSNPLMGFSALMLSAHKDMDKAQSDREAVVQVLRSAATSNFRRAGTELSQALRRFATETAAAETELTAVLNASEAALSKPGKPGDWNMTAARIKGKLTAEVATAKQMLFHIQSQDARELRVGTEQAKQVLEDESSKFDTKLGDMSATVTDAERSLGAFEEHVAERSKMVANSAASDASFDHSKKDLEAAEAKAAKQGVAAKKRLRTALAATGKSLTAQDATILDHVGVTHLEALSGFFSPKSEKTGPSAHV